MSAHKNFVGNQVLDVEIIETPHTGANVCLIQHAGSLAFHFSMTADQARALADDLKTSADRAERLIAARAAA